MSFFKSWLSKPHQFFYAAQFGAGIGAAFLLAYPSSVRMSENERQARSKESGEMTRAFMEHLTADINMSQLPSHDSLVKAHRDLLLAQSK